MATIDNIIVGTLVEGLSEDDIGISPDESNIRISNKRAEELEWFLPRILIEAGLFKNTSEIKRLSAQRQQSTKITDPLSKNLWRNLESPEMTPFKIGKKVFWLVVGQR